ncbi:MAG TPA: hypothetical protein VI111_05865 [Thermoleophilaceae bacterium]
MSMADEAFIRELREEMRVNRAALYGLRQVNRTLVVAVNENVEVTREVRDEVRGMRAELRAELRLEGQATRVVLLEMRDALKAHTDAVLQVLDELRGRGPSDATA